MKIRVSQFNSTTDDLTIVIDLLRASTTITVALNNFNKVIPVNSTDKALDLQDNNTILAGEKDLKPIEGFDLSNSPHKIKDYTADTLVLKTTNGTRGLENIYNRNKNIKILIGSAINARAVADKALSLATDEIELIMAGWHGLFSTEDCIGAGLIVEEIVNIANERSIDLDVEESALISKLLASNHDRARELIDTSLAAERLTKHGFKDDIVVCHEISKLDIVPLYKDGKIINL